MSDKFFTVIRMQPADDDRLPDGFLFSKKDEAFTEDELFAIIKDDQFRKFFDKPLYVFNFTTDEDFRAVLTCDPYNHPQFSDHFFDTTVIFEEPSEDLKLKKVNYAKRLNGCFELYRSMGCKECPYLGLECVKKNMIGASQVEGAPEEEIIKDRPWWLVACLRRRNEFNTGLNDETNTDLPGLYKYVDEHEMKGGVTLADLFKQLDATATISGYTYQSPDKTRREETPRFQRPLRAHREHMFFKPAQP